MEVTSAEKPNPAPLPPEKKERDFLHHVESFLSRRDGVDKLLKISRYAAKIILSTSSSLPEDQTLTLIPRLKSFESSVGLSRKAFRLGKFVQDVNSLRSAVGSSRQKSDLLLAVVAYGGEGFYFFVEQLVWLSKTGLIPAEKSKLFTKISAWAELVGYIGSISIKVRELDRIRSELVLESRKDGNDELRRKLKEKMALKWLSVVQDLADGLMALADVRDGKGAMTGPTLMASAGMLSALISAHKNWNSC